MRNHILIELGVQRKFVFCYENCTFSWKIAEILQAQAVFRHQEW
jgi:hypothetical protein